MNSPFEARKNYDVLWEDIKINVKYTGVFHPRTGAVSFNIKVWPATLRQIVYLCIAEREGEYRYWVVPAIYDAPRTFHFDSGMAPDDIPEMVRLTKKLMDSYK